MRFTWCESRRDVSKSCEGGGLAQFSVHGRDISMEMEAWKKEAGRRNLRGYWASWRKNLSDRRPVGERKQNINSEASGWLKMERLAAWGGARTESRARTAGAKLQECHSASFRPPCLLLTTHQSHPQKRDDGWIDAIMTFFHSNQIYF